MRPWCNHIWMQWEGIRLDGKNDLVEKINSTKYWNVSYWNVGSLSLDDFGTWVPAICLGCSWNKGWFRQSGQLCSDPLNYICWPPPSVSIFIRYFAHQSLLLTFPGLWDGPSVTLLPSYKAQRGCRVSNQPSEQLWSYWEPHTLSLPLEWSQEVFQSCEPQPKRRMCLQSPVTRCDRFQGFASVIVFCLFLHLSLALKKCCPITFRK